MKSRSLAPLPAALCAVLFASALTAQDRPTVSPGVGQAVLLAQNSIQVDSGVVVNSGDLIVNAATSGAVYGEAALSLDRTSHTPAGYRIAATSIDVDRDAVAGGDAYYNTLVNDGTISGSLFTPLSLPVFAGLPPALSRAAGTDDVIVPPGGSVDLAEGAYARLVVGRGGVVRFSGGGYAFTLIDADREASLRFAAPSDVVVTGRIAVGRDAYIGPAPSSGVSASAIRIQANGSNGSDGALRSTPAAIDFGISADVLANVHAPNGSLVFGSAAEATGAFLARDILVGRDGRFTLSSGWNQAPAANAQTVFTSGTSPLTITLTGSDPEGSALTFSIVSGPSAGTLSSPSQASPTSATVVYTPAAAGVEDAFTFRVRDSGGATGDAVVSINPTGGDPRPPDPTTVTATDSSVSAGQNATTTLALLGTAPSGVSLTFSIVSGSGPSHGTLGSVTQGTESPQRSASVAYTPAADYLGSDSFQFEACGVISGNTVCDTATVGITVIARPDPTPATPNLVNDISTTTLADQEVSINLGPTSQSFSRRITITPHAAVLLPAAIAGNVADSNNDGLGDNHNALPGSAPVFMSAGVGQSGGAGSNGTTRMQMEFDISNYAGTVDSLQSASITLPTHRGTIDSADTFFWWVTSEGDGALGDSDYEASAERLSGVTMPVPPSMTVGDTGSFTFSVLDQVKTAMRLGRQYFVVQGRVDESQGGSVRGLEVRTTADGNLPSDVPGLALATPGITPPITYTITSLPSFGVLRTSGGTLITAVPFTLADSDVRYTPNLGYLGGDSFGFEATNGTVVDSALVTILVRLARCDLDVSACNNGR